MLTSEPFVPEPSPFKFEIVIEKLKRYKSPSIYQILAQLIQVGSNVLRVEIHKCVHSICNKESIPILIYKENDKISYSSFTVILLFSSTYKILSNILVSRLSTYGEEIIGDNQCGFLRYSSTTDKIFCIR
jgi:hypothetical protein